MVVVSWGGRGVLFVGGSQLMCWGFGGGAIINRKGDDGAAGGC